LIKKVYAIVHNEGGAYDTMVDSMHLLLMRKKQVGIVTTPSKKEEK